MCGERRRCSRLLRARARRGQRLRPPPAVGCNATWPAYLCQRRETPGLPACGGRGPKSGNTRNADGSSPEPAHLCRGAADCKPTLVETGSIRSTSAALEPLGQLGAVFTELVQSRTELGPNFRRHRQTHVSDVEQIWGVFDRIWPELRQLCPLIGPNRVLDRLGVTPAHPAHQSITLGYAAE